MHGQLHLSRRGSAYQWRRRIRTFSTKIVDLKLSLGTTDRRVAIILARRISAESDDIMDDIIRTEITPEEARAWLSDVIRREREKIEKLQMLRRFDSDDPQDDARHDDAARSAWAHLAQAGLHSHAPEGTPDLVLSNIKLFRRDLTSESRRRIVAREFKDLTGRETVSAFELVTLMNLLISGKRAAWAGHEAALEPMETLADALSSQAPSALLGHTPSAPTASATCEVPHVLSTPPPPRLDPTIAAVIERLIAMKREEGIEEKTLRQYRSFGEIFTLLSGITDIREIRQTDATAFRAALQKIPKSWGKSPSDRDASRAEIMSRAATLPPDKIGLSTGTINRHLDHLSQVASWAADEGFALDPRLDPSKLRRKETVRESDKKDAFTPAQLDQLFSGPVWTGSESEYYQTRPGKRVYRNGLYWCPIIAAVTGARREEISGLTPDDIIEFDGIPCISIVETEQRRIKTLSSRRIVPIHSRLIALGFLDHVAKIQRDGHPDLFPDLREPKSGKHGRKLGRRMRQVIDDTLGLESAALSFQSFRHYVQNALEQAEVNDKIIRDIVGHEGRDVHEKVYHKPTPPALMRPAIEALQLRILGPEHGKMV